MKTKIPMQFRLGTLFLLFVVLWSSLAIFGSVGGVVMFVLAVGLAIHTSRATSARLAAAPLVLLGGLLLLIALLVPAVQNAREAARRLNCMGPLKHIVLAMHEYNQAYGCFPPAYIPDKNGKPMHSWRVLILPFLGESESNLYKQYNFNEPWDGPNNRKLLPLRPFDYICPSVEDPRALGAPRTSYTNNLAVVGRDTGWRGKTPMKLADFQGKAGESILVVEAVDAGIPWTEPRDLDLDDPAAAPCAGVSSKHTTFHGFFFHDTWTGANAGFADGGVQFLPSALLRDKRFPSLLRLGRMPQANQDADRTDEWPPIHWPNCAAFAVWLASVGLLLTRAVRSRKSDAGRRPSPSLSPEQRSGDEENEIPLSRPRGPTVPLRDSTDAP
jgi:hypothetical protein